jgi:hypothetical protein
MEAVRQGPIEIAMNDGQKLVIRGVESCVVDDIAALACMATIAPLESTQVF